MLEDISIRERQKKKSVSEIRGHSFSSFSFYCNQNILMRNSTAVKYKLLAAIRMMNIEQGILNVELGRISAKLLRDSGYTIYFFVLIQKSNKKNQGC